MEPQGTLFSPRNFPSSDAVFSPCRRYRYTLSRTWDSTLPTVNFIMLNPSTADETVDDPTIARQIVRSKLWGYGSLVITNLFAWRSTDPSVLPDIEDPVGEMNDGCIEVTARHSDLVIVGWGNHGGLRGRSQAVLKLLEPITLKALKVTKEGHPQHPLYLPYNAVPEAFDNGSN
jgi:hypothetical protein